MDEVERCYASALRILKVRFNSTAELRRKLQAKGFAAEIINAALERLAKDRWIDDERFATAYVRSRQKQKGRLRIRSELIRAGVDNEVIRRAVAENVDGEEEQARAAALAAKRLPILLRRYAPEVARNKLTAYLLNQGYDGSLVYDTVQKALKRVAGSE